MYLYRVRWKAWTLSAVVLVVGLTVGGTAIGLVHGPAGVLTGAVLIALATVTAGFIPGFRDHAETRRAMLAAALKAWRRTGEPKPPDDGVSLAALLRPDRGIVKFTGREAELELLRAWCNSAATRSVKVLAGTGGVGKTRLALELAAEWEAAGRTWQLVAVGQENTALSAARGVTTGRVLLVIDYAETRAGLESLVEELLEDTGPVRVLLLARSLGEWWERLAERSAPAVAQLLKETAPLQLSASLADHKPDVVLAAEAVQYFADALKKPAPVAVGFDLPAGPVPVLVLHAAALVAVLRSPNPSGTPLRVAVVADVLDELLEHEARYWRRSAEAAGLASDGFVLKPVVAAAALLGAASLDEAGEVAGRVPDLSDVSRGDRRRWAHWLYGLYPAASDGRLGPLQPDLLAETLVSVQLAADPALARACLEHLPPIQADHAMTVLAQAWIHHDVRPLVKVALRRNLGGLAIPAAQAAIQTRAELSGLLAEALADAPASLEVLIGLAEALPYPSVVLAQAHLAVTWRIRQSLPAGTGRQEAAKWADRTGTVLAAVGRPADALPITQEAVDIYRELVNGNPGRYRPDLARALDNLGVWLWELGRPADALPVTQEAVDIYRELVNGDPGRYRPDLARALDNLGVWLSELGRPIEAFPATREAVAIRRAIVAPRPGSGHSALARALANLGVRYSELGRPAEALPVTQEAVGIYEELTVGNPDRYRPDLARALDNLGVRYSELGRPAEALPVTQEAVAVRRDLADRSPDRYRPDLASSLDHEGVRFGALGRPAQALPAAEEAVSIYRELAAADPQRYRPDFARALSNLGVWLWTLGILEEALTVTLEAVTIRRELAAAAGRYQADLAQSLNNLGTVYAALGRPSDALPVAREAVAGYRQLALENQGRYRHDLAEALQNLADVFTRMDQDTEAADTRADAQAVRQTL